MEANVSYLVSICDVVRAAATCEQMQNSQKENFQTNFQRVPGSSSHINPQHMPYQYCSAAPIEANASYFVSIWDVVRAGATCEQMQNSQKENVQANFQRVPGSPSRINPQHMPYQYCSAAPIEADASYFVSIWDVVRAGATCEQMQKSQKENFQANFQRVPGSPSRINPQHMPYQYCSAAPMEANASYLVSICDVVRAAATCEQMQNSQKENFQANFQRVPGSPSHINPQHIPYQYCRAAPIEANASYFVSIWDVVRAGATCEQMQNSQKRKFPN